MTESIPRSYPRHRYITTTVVASYIEKYESKVLNAYYNNTLIRMPYEPSVEEYILYKLHKFVDNAIVYLSQFKVFQKLALLKYQPKTEPMMGTFGFLIDHDLLIFAAAFLYVVIRLVVFAYNLIQWLSSIRNATE